MASEKQSWRSSSAYITWVVGFGVATDLFVYSIVIPVVPFRLQSLGYDQVSGRTGWLLFAFSAGLVLSTPFVVYFSEKYKDRRTGLVGALIILIGSQVMFMEAPNYGLMLFSRFLSGVSSTFVWTLGLALLCDVVPEAILGRQLGLAMSGLSLGMLIAPPLGGVVYSHLGFRAPFILAIGAAAADLVFRLLVVELKERPASAASSETTVSSTVHVAHDEKPPEPVPAAESSIINSSGRAEAKREVRDAGKDASHKTTESNARQLSSFKVLRYLLTSPRALAASLNTLFYGVCWSVLEPTLPLHLQAIYGFDALKVGLAWIASVVPTIFSSPLAGIASDRWGVEWISAVSLICSVPWWFVMIIHSSIVLFLAALALASFFASSIIAPLTAELASVARSKEGVGYAHVYGIFNLAFGIGTSVGPLIGGQVYDHSRNGWTVACSVIAAVYALAAVLVFWFTGERPLGQRLFARRKTATVGRDLES